MIQCYIKGAQAKKKMEKYRHMLNCTRKIQTFYKKRYALKVISSMRLQKYMKGLKVFKKFNRLRAVRHATLNILN